MRRAQALQSLESVLGAVLLRRTDYRVYDDDKEYQARFKKLGRLARHAGKHERNSRRGKKYQYHRVGKLSEEPRNERFFLLFGKAVFAVFGKPLFSFVRGQSGCRIGSERFKYVFLRFGMRYQFFLPFGL